MNRRDEQIARVKQRAERLREPPGRLESCYEQILRAYEAESIVEHVARVIEEGDRTPSDFRVLTNSEARHLWEFNDRSYHWDRYCWELGRSIALGERKYLFESLTAHVPDYRTIDAEEPDFGVLSDAVYNLSAGGYSPDVLCAPIGLFMPFSSKESGLIIDWTVPRTQLVLPTGQRLKIFWSSRAAPLDRFIVFDSSHSVWKYKPDPESGGRLTIAIGEPETPPGAVVFLAETVVKHEVKDLEAFRSIPLSGEPLAPEEYANREYLR